MRGIIRHHRPFSHSSSQLDAACFFTLFEKSKFCPKIKFWQNPNIFTSFSPKFFWQFFSWNQSCQQLKSPKPQHFREFFTPKNWQFSRKIKVEFSDKRWRFRTVWDICKQLPWGRFDNITAFNKGFFSAKRSRFAKI